MSASDPSGACPVDICPGAHLKPGGGMTKTNTDYVETGGTCNSSTPGCPGYEDLKQVQCLNSGGSYNENDGSCTQVHQQLPSGALNYGTSPGCTSCGAVIPQTNYIAVAIGLAPIAVLACVLSCPEIAVGFLAAPAAFGAGFAAVWCLISGSPCAELPAGGEGPVATPAFGVDESMVAELRQAGTKFDPASLIATGRRSSDGKIVFLESGNDKAGLAHIVGPHGSQFEQMGIPEAKIPDFVMTGATTGEIVGYQGKGTGSKFNEV